MTVYSDALWTEASHDHEAAHDAEVMGAAQVAGAEVWSVLASAESEQDFYTRLALLEPRIHAVAASIAPEGTPDYTRIVTALPERYFEDWHLLAEARRREVQVVNARRAAARAAAREARRSIQMVAVERVADGWCCTDCLMLIANGDTSGFSGTDEEKAAWLAEVDRRSEGINWVPGDDEMEFSSIQCDVCGTRLAGYRHEVIGLGTTASKKTAANCACAHNTDGSTTTMLCPVHADEDPCYTKALVTGRRREGTIRNGTCTNCGWTTKNPKTASPDPMLPGIGPKDPGFGSIYGGSSPAYTTTDGTPVWMWRKGQRVRFYDADGNQVGPEQDNVAPAVAYAHSQGWDPHMDIHWTASMHKGAPFAGYDDFDACVAANQDKDDPEAYCGKIKHQVEDGKTSAKGDLPSGYPGRKPVEEALEGAFRNLDWDSIKAHWKDQDEQAEKGKTSSLASIFAAATEGWTEADPDHEAEPMDEAIRDATKDEDDPVKWKGAARKVAYTKDDYFTLARAYLALTGTHLEADHQSTTIAYALNHMSVEQALPALARDKGHTFSNMDSLMALDAATRTTASKTAAEMTPEEEEHWRQVEEDEAHYHDDPQPYPYYNPSCPNCGGDHAGQCPYPWIAQHDASKKAAAGRSVSPDQLSDLMEFDHVIQVHEDGTVTEPSGVYAPSMYDGELDSSDWEFFSTGYTGQYGYNGPVMHDSEQLSGRLAEDILSTPGIYAAIISNYYPEGDDPNAELDMEGWAVVRKKGHTASKRTAAGDNSWPPKDGGEKEGGDPKAPPAAPGAPQVPQPTSTEQAQPGQPGTPASSIAQGTVLLDAVDGVVATYEVNNVVDEGETMLVTVTKNGGEQMDLRIPKTETVQTYQAKGDDATAPVEQPEGAPGANPFADKAAADGEEAKPEGDDKPEGEEKPKDDEDDPDKKKGNPFAKGSARKVAYDSIPKAEWERRRSGNGRLEVPANGSRRQIPEGSAVRIYGMPEFSGQRGTVLFGPYISPVEVMFGGGAKTDGVYDVEWGGQVHRVAAGQVVTEAEFQSAWHVYDGDRIVAGGPSISKERAEEIARDGLDVGGPYGTLTVRQG